MRGLAVCLVLASAGPVWAECVPSPITGLESGGNYVVCDRPGQAGVEASACTMDTWPECNRCAVISVEGAGYSTLTTIPQPPPKPGDILVVTPHGTIERIWPKE